MYCKLSIDDHGFTLIESVVVLAILVIIISIIPPLFFNSINHAKARAACWQIMNDLQKARNKAIINNKITKLTFDARRNEYNDDKYRYSLNLPEKSKLSIITSDSEVIDNSKAAISFYPDGSSSGGQINIKSAYNRYVIDINWLTGKVTFHG